MVTKSPFKAWIQLKSSISLFQLETVAIHFLVRMATDSLLWTKIMIILQKAVPRNLRVVGGMEGAIEVV